MPRKPLEDKLNTKSRNFLDELQRIDTKPLAAESPAAEEANDDQAATSKAVVKDEPEILPAKPKSAKMKVNLYIETAIKRRTEKIQNDLREIAPQDSASRINYSMIVETALQIAFEEFDRTRENSRLFQEIVKQLRDK